jgi:hypothetical protein
MNGRESHPLNLTLQEEPVIQALQWAALAGFATAVSASALVGLMALKGWRAFQARNRRAIRAIVEREVIRQVGPISAKIANHDLELELLTALTAEAKRHSRPNLSIARTGGEPDLDAA